jgi:hypothetical protein
MSTGFFTLRIAGNGTVTISQGSTVLYTRTGPGNFSIGVTIGGIYNISYTSSSPDTIFSRYSATTGIGNTINMGSLTTSATTFQLSFPLYSFGGNITVYVKSPLLAQLEGDGAINITSTNPNDPTALNVSGYNASGTAFFEQNYPGINNFNFICTYTPPLSGYSFGFWDEVNQINPYTTIVRGPSQMVCTTLVDVGVTQNISGSTVSIPSGINTNDSQLTTTGNVRYESTVSLTAIPNPGYYFVKWVNGIALSFDPTITVTPVTPLSLTATFAAETDIHTERARDYVPNQGERADAQHICQCPCACTGCSPAFTSALNRTRQTRALISGSCCQEIPVGVVIINGGTDYAVGDLLQVQGGTPLEQPALFRVSSVGVGGVITDLQLIYGQPYRILPESDTLTVYTGSGIGGTFTVIWTSCGSPANLYRQ